MAERSVLHVVLDSGGRDRSAFPNPCDFSAFFGTSVVADYRTSNDPIVDAAPHETSTTQAGSTATVIQLNATANTTVNFYVGAVLEIAGEFRTVTGYVFPAATVSPAFSGAPLAGVQYTVRYGFPRTSSVFQAGSTVTQLVLDATSNDYTNFFIYIRDGVAAGQLARIREFDNLTKIATLNSAIAAAPAAGDAYDILVINRSNNLDIPYRHNHRGVTQPVPYRIKLISLSFPNVDLLNTGGGRIVDLSDIQLSLEFSDGSCSAVTGNFRGTPVFIVNSNDVNTTTPFVHLETSMLPEVLFSPVGQIRMRLSNMRNETLLFAPDRLSPFRPNLALQVRAVFAFERLLQPTHFTAAHLGRARHHNIRDIGYDDRG